MHTNTQQKAPRASDSEGLHTDTNASDYRNQGPIQQSPDTEAIATQIARLALDGHVVHKGAHGDFTVCKFGLARYCADFAALVAFAKKVGAA